MHVSKIKLVNEGGKKGVSRSRPHTCAPCTPPHSIRDKDDRCSQKEQGSEGLPSALKGLVNTYL